MSICIRGSCQHSQSNHFENNIAEVICLGYGTRDDGAPYCDCPGFQDEPSEAQLDALNNATSFRELQDAAWQEKRMLDRG